MRIAVLGGTGTLGRAVVTAARAAGHKVVSVSRGKRPSVDRPVGVTEKVADVTKDAGLAETLSGVHTVVDATNSLNRSARVLVGGTARVLRFAKEAGVRHFVGVSVVGIDDAPFPYYRVKLEQEKAIASGEVPWSMLRATQFHDLVAGFASGHGGVVLAPMGWKLQPIDAGEVAAAVLAAVAAGPVGRLPDVAGPNVELFSDLVRAWKAATGKRRLVIPVPIPGAGGRYLRSGRMCNPDRAVGKISFATWLSGSPSSRRAQA